MEQFFLPEDSANMPRIHLSPYFFQLIWEQTAKSQGADLKNPDAKQGIFDAFFGNLSTASNANAAQLSTTSGDLFANLTGK